MLGNNPLRNRRISVIQRKYAYKTVIKFVEEAENIQSTYFKIQIVSSSYLIIYFAPQIQVKIVRPNISHKRNLFITNKRVYLLASSRNLLLL